VLALDKYNHRCQIGSPDYGSAKNQNKNQFDIDYENYTIHYNRGGQVLEFGWGLVWGCASESARLALVFWLGWVFEWG